MLHSVELIAQHCKPLADDEAKLYLGFLAPSLECFQRSLVGEEQEPGV